MFHSCVMTKMAMSKTLAITIHRKINRAVRGLKPAGRALAGSRADLPKVGAGDGMN